MHALVDFALELNDVPLLKSKPNLQTYALGAQGKACDVAELHFCENEFLFKSV